MDLIETFSLQCPYCGEAIEVVVDCSEADQDYTEDCEVCCRPIAIKVRTAERDSPHVEMRREDE
jgi:Cysteine-rich CPXCG